MTFIKSKPCPNCGSIAIAQFIDIGVGFTQGDPFCCTVCNWVESGCPADECIGWKCKSYLRCRGRAI